jgi:hypothetical protein
MGLFMVRDWASVELVTYLSSSLARAVLALFRLGTGIRHSMENATQLVHGTLRMVKIKDYVEVRTVPTRETPHRIEPRGTSLLGIPTLD